MDRNKGRQCLGLYLQSQNNINLLERYIFEVCSGDTSINGVDYTSAYTSAYYDMIYSTSILLKTHKNVKVVLNHLKNKNFNFSSDKFAEVALKLDEQDCFIINPIEVVEGVLDCPRCKSKRSFTFTSQTRSADEATTVFAECADCGKKWKANN